MAISPNQQIITETPASVMPMPDQLLGQDAGVLYASLLRHGVVKAAILGSGDTDHEVVNDMSFYASRMGEMAIHLVRSPGSLSQGRDVDPANILGGIRDFANEHKDNGLIIVRSANFAAPIAKGCEETAVELLGIIKDTQAPKVMITGRYGKNRNNQSLLVSELNDRFASLFHQDNSFSVAEGVVTSAACSNTKYAHHKPTYHHMRLGGKGLST